MIEPAFLPAKTTSILRLLDKGVIYSLKMDYRRKFLFIEKKKDSYLSILSEEVDIRRVILKIIECWEKPFCETMRACFYKTGLFL